MAGRGRRPGYINYTASDQVLLCTIVEELIPIGRNQWEQVTIQFNANRSRGSPEQDLDSLRRKLKTLYMSKKPTGSGEVPIRLRPIMMAKAAQLLIEAQGGVHTSHDGLGRGEDDGEFLPLEEETARSTMGAISYSDLATDTAHEDLIGQNEEENNRVRITESTASLQAYRDAADLDVAEEARIQDTTQGRDGEHHHVELSENSADITPSTGAIFTNDRVIDASIAHMYNLSEDGASTAEDEGVPDVQHSITQEAGNVSTPTNAATTTPPKARTSVKSQTVTRKSTLGSRRSTPRDSITPAQEQATTSKSTRSVGGPRWSRRDPLPTVASPEGPRLQRNPSRAAIDAREEENCNWNIASNRLGGSDLRVFRDNLLTMTSGGANTSGKRRLGEANKPDGVPGTLSSAKNRRVKTKARLDDIQKEIEAAEKKQTSAGNEIMGMLLLFQKEGDRRAEEDKRQRREEREERREAEKKDREERERMRIEAAKAALEMKLEDARAARQMQEENRRANGARDAQLESERDENKRRFEERLALNREEARQRHEQMLLVARLKK